MAMITCKECKGQVSSKAEKCPNCGAAVKSGGVLKLLAAGFAVVVLVGTCSVVLGGRGSNAAPSAGPSLNPIEHAIDAAADNQMAKIEAQVALDSVKQYEMIKRNKGGAIDLCVHAGMVEAAYLQAKDEAKYAEWQGIKKADCKAAGMPE